VMIASSMGMSTVVQGVETEAQAALVRQLGCNEGQDCCSAGRWNRMS